MDVLVCIKRVPMVGTALILTDDGTELDTRRLGFQLSPHEENAVEAAVQLIEQHGGTVTLLTMGTAEAEEQLREQLAIGADRAIIALTDGTEPDPQATAAGLLDAIRADGASFDVILMGSESADVGGYQTGIRLAHALGLPVVTNVKGLSISDGTARCERAVGSEREVYEVTLPAVITVKDGLNIPRYPSVPGRIKARKKPVTTHEVALAAPRIVKHRLVVPEATAKGTKVLEPNAEGAAALVEVFREIGVLS
jgi:electron transfer flavoprotein beta subunit